MLPLVQNEKSVVQRKTWDLWNISIEKKKKDRLSTIFKKCSGKSTKRMFTVKFKDWRILGISKTRPAKPPKTKPPAIFVATKTNVANDAIEVVDDSKAPASSKKSGNKRDYEIKNTPAKNRLRTESGEINDELASYTCIRERT